MGLGQPDLIRRDVDQENGANEPRFSDLRGRPPPAWTVVRQQDPSSSRAVPRADFRRLIGCAPLAFPPPGVKDECRIRPPRPGVTTHGLSRMVDSGLRRNGSRFSQRPIRGTLSDEADRQGRVGHVAGSRLDARIAESFAAARRFLENSAAPVPNGSDGEFGFPVYRGKGRVTECGGTSAAVRALRQLGVSGPSAGLVLEGATQWLLNRQSDGSWEAGGFAWSEVTALVLLDLQTTELPKGVVDDALEYLRSCRRPGYYASHPSSLERPHIFTTFACVRCVSVFGHLDNPAEIAEWLDAARAPSGNWGFHNRALDDSPAATAFALTAMADCLGSWEAVASKYPASIKWLAGLGTRLPAFEEETITLPKAKADSAGQPAYHKLRVGHYTRAEVGRVLASLGYKAEVLRIAWQVVGDQHEGGWGPNKETLTMWATQKAVAILSDVRVYVLPNVGWVHGLAAQTRRLPAWTASVGWGVLIGVFLALMIALPEFRAQAAVACFVAACGLGAQTALRYVQ